MPREQQPIQQVIVQQSENLIRFHIALNFDLREITKLSPERITALFSGIAEVMKAKAALERNEQEGFERSGK